MKKIFLTTVALLTMLLPTFGEISTGEPHSSVIPHTGNRPEKGDWGMYIGGSVTQIIELVDAIGNDEYNAWGLPLVNLKYYISDPLELRLGMQFACKSTNAKTTMDSGANGKAVENHNYTRFQPGIAYHFSNSNILDVYAGAQLPIGWEVDKNLTQGFADGYNYLHKERVGTFVIGGGLFLGLQVFIADLPFAIGVEGGFSGLIKAGGIPKTTIQDGTTKQVYYNHDTSIIKASRTEATWGGGCRYYFFLLFSLILKTYHYETQ